MRGQELGDFQKPDFVFPFEDLLQLLIAEDLPLVSRILKIVGLDIGPNLFDGVGTCGFTGTKELSESWRDSRRLEDSRSPRRLLLRQRVWFRLWLRFRLRFRRRLLGASSGDSACTSGRRGGGSRCRS